VSALSFAFSALAQGLGGPAPKPPIQLGTPPPQGPPEGPAREVTADVSPVLSDSVAFFRGLTELVLRVRNRGAAPVRVEIKAVAPTAYGGKAGVEVRAPFAVGASSSVTVALPVRVLGHEVTVYIADEHGQTILERRLNILSRDK